VPWWYVLPGYTHAPTSAACIDRQAGRRRGETREDLLHMQPPTVPIEADTNTYCTTLHAQTSPSKHHACAGRSYVRPRRASIVDPSRRPRAPVSYSSHERTHRVSESYSDSLSVTRTVVATGRTSQLPYLPSSRNIKQPWSHLPEAATGVNPAVNPCQCMLPAGASRDDQDNACNCDGT
jgi:hypothetical protein